MLNIKENVKEIRGISPHEMPDEILRSTQPLLLKGLVGDWPMVQAAKKSARDADLYLRQFNQDETVGAFFGEPNAQGRVYYNEDLSGFNYQPVMSIIHREGYELRVWSVVIIIAHR